MSHTYDVLAGKSFYILDDHILGAECLAMYHFHILVKNLDTTLEKNTTPNNEPLFNTCYFSKDNMYQ